MAYTYHVIFLENQYNLKLLMKIKDYPKSYTSSDGFWEW